MTSLQHLICVKHRLCFSNKIQSKIEIESFLVNYTNDKNCFYIFINNYPLEIKAKLYSNFEMYIFLLFFVGIHQIWPGIH